MGISMKSNSSCSVAQSHHRSYKLFLICNYILLGAASSCIFLTLSLRLIPSLVGFFLILLHVITIGAAVSACSAATGASNKCYATHMIVTVLTSICQGSLSLLILTRTTDFLGFLKSYVREEDGAVILKLTGGLCVVVFCLEWAMLTLAFVLRYYAFVEGDTVVLGSGGAAERRNAKASEEELKNWPWPFQV